MIKVDDLVVYDVKECAEMLKIAPATVRKYMKQGKLDFQRVGGKLYATEDTIKKFLKGTSSNK